MFDGRRHIPLISIPGMRERCVKIGSAGKIFSLTGWKVGLVCAAPDRSEEHTSELQSQSNLVCRLLLEKKKKDKQTSPPRVTYSYAVDSRLLSFLQRHHL